MKLSQNTLAVLKTFASINVNLQVQQGNVIRTIGPSRNIFAKAELTEAFPIGFAIYDLNSFLQSVTLFGDVDLEFDEKFVLINSASGATIKYFYSDPTIVTAAPNKEIVFDEELFKVDLTQDDVNAVLKVSAALAAPTISFTSKDAVVTMVVGDRKNSTSHNYSKKLVGDVSAKFDVVLRVENFKLLPGDYECTIAKKGTAGVVRWQNKSVPLTVWMTVENDSQV